MYTHPPNPKISQHMCKCNKYCHRVRSEWSSILRVCPDPSCGFE